MLITIVNKEYQTLCGWHENKTFFSITENLQFIHEGRQVNGVIICSHRATDLWFHESTHRYYFGKTDLLEAIVRPHIKQLLKLELGENIFIPDDAILSLKIFI